MDQVQATLEEAFCKGCTRLSNNQAQPTNHARIKNQPPDKTKQNPLREQLASKQASSKSIAAK